MGGGERDAPGAAVGFLGAMIMLRPGSSSFGLGQAFALFSAVSAGIVGPLLKQMKAASSRATSTSLVGSPLLVVSIAASLGGGS